jgi:hypothetical protein
VIGEVGEELVEVDIGDGLAFGMLLGGKAEMAEAHSLGHGLPEAIEEPPPFIPATIVEDAP